MYVTSESYMVNCCSSDPLNSTFNAVNGSMTDHNKASQYQDCSLYFLREEL